MAIYADMEPWGHGFYVYGECSAWDLIHDFLQRCHQTLGAGQFATAIGGFRKYSSFKQAQARYGDDALLVVRKVVQQSEASSVLAVQT